MHSQHHRGQCMTRLKDFGGEPKNVDWIIWLWKQKPPARWDFSSMRIGIVNDTGLVREALRRVVLSLPGHEVAWTANDGAEAVALRGRMVPT